MENLSFDPASVEKTIENMLKESTGRHSLDSGYAYGRHWERNQSKDLASEKQIEWCESNGQIDFVVSVYHYLTSILEFDDRTKEINNILADARLGKLNVLKIDPPHWTGETADFLYKIFEFQESVFLDLIEWGSEWNTYNGENFLSQVLQGISLKIDGDNYVLLQIHNGCDVRGGYTETWCFKLALDCYITGNPVVCGEIDGKQVDTTYNGWKLTDENGEDIVLRYNEDGECISDVKLSF